MVEKAGVNRVGHKPPQPKIEDPRAALLEKLRLLEGSGASRGERLESYRQLLADAKKLPADQQWGVTKSMLSTLEVIQSDTRVLLPENDNLALKIARAIFKVSAAMQQVSGDRFDPVVDKSSKLPQALETQLADVARQPSLTEGFDALAHVAAGNGDKLTAKLGSFGPEWANAAFLEMLGTAKAETGAKPSGLPRSTALELRVGGGAFELSVKEEFAGGARERTFDVSRKAAVLTKLLEGTPIKQAADLSQLLRSGFAGGA